MAAPKSPDRQENVTPDPDRPDRSDSLMTVHRRVRTGARPDTVPCAGCGADVAAARRGPLPKWCGQTCRQRGWERRRAAAELVQHPAVRAAAFTGSYAGGRALFDLAVSRPDPIPFYGELGSVNPAIVTPLAAQRGKPLAIEYLDSLTLGTGQFCTNPGLLLIPAGSGLTQLIADEADTRQPGVMLHAGIAELFRRNVAHLAALPGVRAPVNGSTVNAPGTWSGPTILAADQHAATANPELLHTECFGPAAIVIEYASEQGLLELISRLEGCLVATVHGNENEPIAAAVVQRLARITGRVVWNDWPTGVAVTAAQHHGGPHPATTNSLHTSVGGAAVLRFLRPVAYQSVPNALLPRALRETPDNQHA